MARTHTARAPARSAPSKSSRRLFPTCPHRVGHSLEERGGGLALIQMRGGDDRREAVEDVRLTESAKPEWHSAYVRVMSEIGSHACRTEDRDVAYCFLATAAQNQLAPSCSFWARDRLSGRQSASGTIPGEIRSKSEMSAAT